MLEHIDQSCQVGSPLHTKKFSINAARVKRNYTYTFEVVGVDETLGNHASNFFLEFRMLIETVRLIPFISIDGIPVVAVRMVGICDGVPQILKLFSANATPMLMSIPTLLRELRKFC
jgi:hypothetical protein